MVFVRKVEMFFGKDETRMLDAQSKICNWLYNHMFEMIAREWEKEDGDKTLLQGYHLRDQVPLLKEDYSFLKKLHSSVAKNVALRLKDAYVRFFKHDSEHPKYRSWKKKWFSLLYDEITKGIKFLPDLKVQIGFGVTKENERLYVTGQMTESLHLRKTDRIKTFRLCKQQGNRFYGIFTIEREDLPQKQGEHWISMDPNHKNMFVAVDDKGTSFEFEKLGVEAYWDSVIDRLKSKRDKCKRKAKCKTTFHGKIYYVPSKRWRRLNRALDLAYSRRREQKKSACYQIANWIARKYDTAAIGDYTPTMEVATVHDMHRPMLNQSNIGTFRKILCWTMEKSGKRWDVVDEKGTTLKCCVCGRKEKKEPSIREFLCPKCKRLLGRDINSAVNIAKKAKLLSGSDYLAWNLEQARYTVKWSYRNGELRFTESV